MRRSNIEEKNNELILLMDFANEISEVIDSGRSIQRKNSVSKVLHDKDKWTVHTRSEWIYKASFHPVPVW